MKIRTWYDLGMTTKVNRKYLLENSTRTANGCLIWGGAINKFGYGVVAVQLAHRASYRLFKGEIPDNHNIDHLCSAPACIEPNHLDAVTPKQDGARKKIRNRWRGWATHCANGHELDDHTTFWRSNGTGRQCRVCQHERQREYWARQGKPAKSSKGLRKNGTLKNKALYLLTAQDYETANIDERFIEVFYSCDTSAGSSRGVAAGEQPRGKYQLQSEEKTG